MQGYPPAGPHDATMVYAARIATVYGTGLEVGSRGGPAGHLTAYQEREVEDEVCQAEDQRYPRQPPGGYQALSVRFAQPALVLYAVQRLLDEPQVELVALWNIGILGQPVEIQLTMGHQHTVVSLGIRLPQAAGLHVCPNSAGKVGFTLGQPHDRLVLTQQLKIVHGARSALTCSRKACWTSRWFRYRAIMT